MGFLHKLWDDTVAGPAPDSGLGKLRKYNSFAGRSSSAPPSPTKVGHHHPVGAASDDLMPVSRSITILRSNSTSSRCGNTTPDSGSVPSSPAFSSAYSKHTTEELQEASEGKSDYGAVSEL